MSIAIDAEAEIEGEAYDQEFDENHAVGEEQVTSTCTYLPGIGACFTCA